MIQMQCAPHQYQFDARKLRDVILQSLGWEIWETAISGNLNNCSTYDDVTLPPISVLVCTRNRPVSLERCLGSLSELNYPQFEVVVVDNCSNDRFSVDRVVRRFEFRYVYEEHQGLNWARNRGCQEAQYDIVSFIDDDAIALPGWLKGIAHGFKNQSTMVVTGMVLPAEVETPAQHEFELYGGMNKGFKPYSVKYSLLDRHQRFWASNWGVGTNMAIKKRLIETIGEFDVALDVGTPTRGGGDIEFFYRAVSNGYTIQYEPKAVVKHFHRRDYPSLKRQIYNNGRSFVAYLLTIWRKEPHNRPALLGFALRDWIWKWLLRRLLANAVWYDKLIFKLAFSEILGALSGFSAYRQSQNIKKLGKGS